MKAVAGVNGQIKTINKGKISVPKYTWKVILVENLKTGEVETIAVIMPNSEKVKKTDWTDYLVAEPFLKLIDLVRGMATINEIKGHIPVKPLS